MPDIAPIAPISFYDPAFTTLKTALETVDTIAGQIVLLSAVPADVNAAWAEVGVAADSTQAGVNVGTTVLGFAPIGTITGPVDDDTIEGGTTGEVGRRLQFASIAEVPILENANGTVVCAALVNGKGTFAAGTDADVLYVLDVQNISVDGSPTNVTVSLPSSEISILSAVNKA
jgi:hypothetical protein